MSDVLEALRDSVARYANDSEQIIADLKAHGYDIVPTSMHTVTPKGIVATFRQHDWMPGFAAYLSDNDGSEIKGEAFCMFNLQAFLASYTECDETPERLAMTVADSMMHELMHVIEAWARVEFSEERVEALLGKYRQCPDGYRAPTESEHKDMMVGAILSMQDGMEPKVFRGVLASVLAKYAIDNWESDHTIFSDIWFDSYKAMREKLKERDADR